ncbi:MAG: septal ring lytic transglycosylase RlpA family protein [Gammaproteobacteria bacterium]|nr:septal ring lytic transglycosylase RlpA family protein [Gammaproteobacteria bacterium]
MRLLLICMIATAVSACTFGVPIDRGAANGRTAQQAPFKKSKAGNPSSYVVMGKRYYVMDDAQGFVQRGVASWYGQKFHGRKTSSGEVYNMHAMTAAHKTLPLPSYVLVRNLANGRSVVVKVNDRGPFVGERIIDLSYAAATRLGVTGPGTAQVEISAVNSASHNARRPVVRTIPLTENAAAEVPLFIQMGSFGSVANAENLLRELHDANEKAATVSQLKTSSGLFYRVRVGPLFHIDEANAVIRRLNSKGFSTARIVVQQ